MSTFRVRLLVFGYPLLEIATAYAVAQLIGWGWTLLLLAAGIPVGFTLMRKAGDAAMRDMTAAAGTGHAGRLQRHALSFVGGVLDRRSRVLDRPRRPPARRSRSLSDCSASAAHVVLGAI